MASIDTGLNFDILTPERVSLQYQVAGVGSRGAALLVDGAIQGALLIVLSLFWAVAGGLSPRTSVGGVLLGIWVVLVFVLLFGYFPLLEIAWSGQTPGKRALGLRVLPGFYAVGVIAMLLNPRARRLGDFAAGTVVVRLAPAITPPRLTPALEAPPPVALTSQDASLVRDFLLRRPSIAPDARTALATRLAAALAARYALAEERDPEPFLERLV